MSLGDDATVDSCVRGCRCGYCIRAAGLWGPFDAGFARILVDKLDALSGVLLLRGVGCDRRLQADLDALGWLRPQLQSLVWEVTQGVLNEPPPTERLTRGRCLVGGRPGDVDPDVAGGEAAVAGRFTKLGEMIELARQGFIATDEQLLSARESIAPKRKSILVDEDFPGIELGRYK
jgi:hypothetical protein